MIQKVTIYGERCTGTNYLENLLNANFDITITWEHGYKHFFGFHDLNNTDHVLFIGITRNPYDFINSLYRYQHQLPPQFKNKTNFLNDEFYSLENGKLYPNDLHIYTKEKYKNIFEMRHTKLQFLIDDLPKAVKNYILIRYEDLLNDLKNTLDLIKDKGLIIKNDIEYPINITHHTYSKDILFVKDSKPNFIEKDLIKDRLNMLYENKLNYSIE
jgi:hypothetical protein